MPDNKISRETREGLRNRARELRSEQTAAEESLWKLIRDKKLSGYKFRRQHRIGPYIVDFYCHLKRLVIEVDGPIHENQKEYDQVREDDLRAMGFRVIRFANDDVFGSPMDVVKRILQELKNESNS